MRFFSSTTLENEVCRTKTGINLNAFGQLMPGRNVSSNEYKFGFNGQEKDDEIGGSGNYNTALYWEYDTRTGRRWNTDPIMKDWESPYACFSNNPIWLIDINGTDTSFADKETKAEFDKTYLEITSKIKIYSEDINNLSKNWAKSNYEDEEIRTQITTLNTERAKLLDIKESFDDVISSTDKMFYYTAKPNDGSFIAGGKTEWDKDKSTKSIAFYNITYYSGNQSTIVHETKHGQQKTNGDLKIYDYKDEYDAIINSNNYNTIIWGKTGKTELEIKNYIESYYEKKVSVQSFEQHCIEK
ncbi:MAG TPA: hypothetical protein PKZ43_00040 [Bacteroidales bacterium]|nr:hypothetical protein [Bacteroidales bacterium]